MFFAVSFPRKFTFHIHKRGFKINNQWYFFKMRFWCVYVYFLVTLRYIRWSPGDASDKMAKSTWSICHNGQKIVMGDKFVTKNLHFVGKRQFLFRSPFLYNFHSFLKIFLEVVINWSIFDLLLFDLVFRRQFRHSKAFLLQLSKTRFWK